MVMPRPPFPKSLREFQAKFATEDACAEYLDVMAEDICPVNMHGFVIESGLFVVQVS